MLDRVCVGSTLTDPITTPGLHHDQTQHPARHSVRPDESARRQGIQPRRAGAALLYWEFYNLFNRSNFCNSYEESVRRRCQLQHSTVVLQRPQQWRAPSLDFSAAAVPSFSSQFGFRFNF